MIGGEATWREVEVAKKDEKCSYGRGQAAVPQRGRERGSKSSQERSREDDRCWSNDMGACVDFSTIPRKCISSL